VQTARPAEDCWSLKAWHRHTCRNITILRGPAIPATTDEIEAAARQQVCKVGGVQMPSPAMAKGFEKALRVVAEATAELFAELPQRRNLSATVPPLRRRVEAMG
jgi:hypothetical protein